MYIYKHLFVGVCVCVCVCVCIHTCMCGGKLDLQCLGECEGSGAADPAS